jgi:hypothetical protein
MANGGPREIPPMKIGNLYERIVRDDGLQGENPEIVKRIYWCFPGCLIQFLAIDSDPISNSFRTSASAFFRL